MSKKLNFHQFGHVMGFEMKIKKHLESRNAERVKDYLCAAFNTWNPKNAENHPCIEFIREGQAFLKEEGWKVGLYNWGEEKGVQYTCVSPNDEWYRSHYEYNS